MSKWNNKLGTIRAMIDIGLDSASIAGALGTTPVNVQTVCKRNRIALPGAAKRTAGLVCEIPLQLLRRDPNQPREQFDENKLRELADSLKTEGQESPITFRVTALEDNPEQPFMLVHGERRWRAAQLAGFATILGVLDTRDSTEPDRLLRQISDNEQRENLTPWDWVVAIDRLHTAGLTHEQISKAFTARGLNGFSRSVVSNYCRLLKLPDSAQQLLQQGKITAAHGKYLLQCKDEDIRAKLIAGMVEGVIPTVERLQRSIQWKYEATHRGLNCYGRGDWTVFDWKETCADCQYRHKVDSDHSYCTNPVDECWNGHQAAANRRQAAEREAQEQAAADDHEQLESVDLDDLKQSDPEEAKRIEGLRKARVERVGRQTEHDRRDALRERVGEVAAQATDIDVLMVCALQYVLEDMPLPTDLLQDGDNDDERERTPTQWLELFRRDRIAMLQHLAAESMRGHIYTDDLPHYATMLGLDPNADYRQQSEADEPQEAAA